MNNLSLNLLVGEKSMPQILKVLILVNCFGTFLTCNSGFHIKLIFYVLLKIMNILHEGGVKHFFDPSEGGSDIFFTCLRGVKHFFNIFGISPIQSFSFYCYAPYS